MKRTPLALLGLVYLAATSYAQSASANLAQVLKQFTLPAPELTAAIARPSPSPAPTQIGNLDDRIKNLSRNAPRRENTTGINVGTKYINGLFGGMEQGAGFPFGVEFTTADTIPGVELRARAYLSTRLYRKFEGSIFFPKIGSEKTQAEIWYAHLRRTRDHFFGIGSLTPKTNATNLDLEHRSFNATLSHEVVKGFEVGGYFRTLNASTYTGQNEKEPAIETLFSGSPAVMPLTRYVPGLFFNARSNNVKVAGGGAYVEYDGRDDESGLTQGVYAYGRLGFYESFGSNPLALTDYGWSETEIDVRGYVPLGSRKTSLALRTYADLRNPRDGKQIPVYEMPWLGGRNHLRGYQNFRFRGNNLLLLIPEFRQTVWAQKETRGVDVFVFVDNGKIWGDSRSATNPLTLRNDKFGDQPFRVQPGAGVQYRYNKGFAARLDFAKSNERTMVYFSVSRGF
jgi:outer membrane protein assembly factor BamA